MENDDDCVNDLDYIMSNVVGDYNKESAEVDVSVIPKTVPHPQLARILAESGTDTESSDDNDQSRNYSSENLTNLNHPNLIDHNSNLNNPNLISENLNNLNQNKPNDPHSSHQNETELNREDGELSSEVDLNLQDDYHGNEEVFMLIS